jgi:hypothetical protein
VSVERFGLGRGRSPSTLYGWQRDAQREAAGEKRPRRPRKAKTYTPNQRRAAVEAFRRSGRTQVDFAALWGGPP